MSIPGFQVCFLPLLRRLADGAEHKISDLYGLLADDLSLPAPDREVLLPSGKQFIYVNRIGWARTYLKKAGLIGSPTRGVLTITERGRQVLASPPVVLNVKYLRQFPEFMEFHVNKDPEPPGTQGGESEETPTETPERVQGELERALSAELLERIHAGTPAFFERLVVDLLLAMG